MLIGVGLMASLAVYVVGLMRLWRSAGRGSGIKVLSSCAFFAGWLSLVLALIGPLHRLSEMLFSAHMTQHEVMMLISAPLMIIGRPQIAFTWSIPMNWRRHLSELKNNETFERSWRFVSGTFVAFLIHTAALWIWHAPVLFDATLTSDLVHALQHASFFGTALLFWWSIINGGLDRRASFAGVLFLFLTSLHSGILGAFLTFTRQIWYTANGNSSAMWGLTALEDQHLGGLIMWVPAGLVYIAAGLMMFARTLRQAERRAFEIDRRFLTGSAGNV
jgi:cytochrome c oxidase assembly factor CtaG